MIAKMTLKSGRSPNSPPEEIEVPPVTVFVGPNNSGKTRVLNEIVAVSSGNPNNLDLLLLDTLQFVPVSFQAATSALAGLIVPPRFNDGIAPENVVIGSRANTTLVGRWQIDSIAEGAEANPASFATFYLRFHTLVLGGGNRIALVQAQPAGDLQSPAVTSLQTLFRDDQRRQEARRILFDAFGLHFVVDPTNLGQFRVRFSETPPPDVSIERGLDDRSVQFHAAARSVEEMSDGVKAFTGIITEVLAGDPVVLAIDEPEAFLHPSLALKLGAEIARAALDSEKRVFASTHSPNFVMGCIQSGAPVNVIRLTYRGGIATTRVLASGELVKLMRNPLLRSTNLLNALFYEFVVVTESDADRAFYQEVNERLLRYKPEWGIPNCLFINAQNKQTVPTLVQPLRKLGIPAAGIVDVDVVKEGGSVWTNLLSSASVPVPLHAPLGAIRTSVKDALVATRRDMKRDGGTALLNGDAKESAQNLLDQVAGYGIFVVPGGELESWLKHLGAAGHGPAWLINMFEKLGEDPADADYVKPGDGDVWKFMGDLKAWLMDPNRKGIPE